MRSFYFYLCLSFAAMMPTHPVKADLPPCGGKYVIAPGDTLSEISKRFYDTGKKWKLIVDHNRGVLGGNLLNILPGTEIRIPCLKKNAVKTSDAKPRMRLHRTKPATTTEKDEVGRIVLLTTSNSPPFTDKNLPAGGMLTEIVSEAFKRSMGTAPRKILWLKDRNSRLNHLFKNRMRVYMGFPWVKPDCSAAKTEKSLGKSMIERCEFIFSKPLFNLSMSMFGKSDGEYRMDNALDLHNKTLCRPVGENTLDLERIGLEPGENITLERPENTAACFRMLMKGLVDLVTVDELTGRTVIRRMGLDKKIKAVENISTINPLHLVVHKSHPDALVFMNHFNTGLKDLENAGLLDKIKKKHLAGFHGDQNP